MRRAAIVFAVLSVCLATSLATIPAAAAPTVEELFRAFDLFGNWAADCQQAASPANPHVAITMPSPGLVQEDHSLGSEFTINRYSVLSATRLSDTQLAVAVIFQPGTENEERQKLEFLMRKNTRRTMFNQVEGGPVRVKDGVALAHKTKTPVLRKCD
jgi:hypothetical protein